MKKNRINGSGWCVCCGETVGTRANGALYCWSCCKLISRVASKMAPVVKQAIANGVLKTLVGQVCVDCGEPAKFYDHRNILRPLEVKPVCHGCNVRRGPPSGLTKKIVEEFLAITGRRTGRPKKAITSPKSPRKKQLTIAQLRLKRRHFNWSSKRRVMYAAHAKAKMAYQETHGLRPWDYKDYKAPNWSRS